MNPIPMWAYGVVFAALLGVAGVQTVRLADAKQDNADLVAAHATELAKQKDDALLAEQAAREREHNLQDNAAIAAKEKQDELDTTNGKLAAALERLRNRPERPAAVANGSTAPAAAAKGATGAELFRPDAEFLSREAARADGLRAALAECYRVYDAAAKVK